MGRELKRVPLDFEWPLNERWKGYLNPLYTAAQCAACKGSGYSLEAERLKNLWYGYAPFKPEDRGSAPFTPADAPVRAFAERNVGHAPDFYGSGKRAIAREAERLCRLFNSRWSHHLNDVDVAALIESRRLYDFTHTFTPGTGWAPKDPPVVPMAREVNEWSLSGFGHDSINNWVCIKAECNRNGWPHTCAACGGEGCVWPSEEAKAAYEAWERIEPPSGHGYQIWETVSEGSPISPVFETARGLAAHMAATKWGADNGTPFETWLAFIEGPGWAPSLVVQGGVVSNGITAMVAQNAAT